MVKCNCVFPFKSGVILSYCPLRPKVREEAPAQAGIPLLTDWLPNPLPHAADQLRPAMCAEPWEVQAQRP